MAAPKDTKQEHATRTAQKPARDTNMPGILQLSFLFSRLIVVIVAVSVPAVSYFNGASPLDMGLRTACALLGVGFLLWIVNMKLARGAFDAMAEDLKEQQELALEGAVVSTREEKV